MITHKEALGLIETKGLIPAIEAADAMVKAASVRLIGKELAEGGLVRIAIRGEVGAVKSAVSAGQAAAERVGEFLWSHIIPRPDPQTELIIGDSADASPQISGQQPPPDRDISDIDNMTVPQLRQLARTIPALKIKGREISKANKVILLQQLKNYYKSSASK